MSFHVLQIMRDYVGGATIAAETGNMEHLALEKNHFEAAARIYLSRGVVGVSSEPKLDAKPCKCRKKSLEWGIAIDKALRALTSKGWDRFEVSEYMAKNVDPYQWPAASMSPDQGPDGYCFLSALTNGCYAPLKFNVEVR
jgi:hypothetical protein